MIHLRDDILKSQIRYYEGLIAKHQQNVEVYLTYPVGIGEHPDIMAAIDSEISAVAQAHEADRILMAKHNRTATIISMILGLICLALFVDGLLRILGIIPPFMDLDVNVIDDVIEKVEEDIMPMVEPYVKKGLQYIPRR